MILKHGESGWKKRQTALVEEKRRAVVRKELVNSLYATPTVVTWSLTNTLIMCCNRILHPVEKRFRIYMIGWFSTEILNARIEPSLLMVV
jgi:hypothetical protein